VNRGHSRSKSHIPIRGGMLPNSETVWNIRKSVSCFRDLVERRGAIRHLRIRLRMVLEKALLELPAPGEVGCN
jgi:hypothetical protein